MSNKAFIVFCVQALFAHVAFSQCVRSGGDYTWGLVAPSAGVSPCGSQFLYDQTLGAGLVSGSGVGNVNGHTRSGFSTGGIEITPTSGGALPVYSASAIAPSPLSMASENAFQGTLNVFGELPFLSAVALEGVLPSGGAGAVNYGCGNGITAITSEIGNPAGAVGIGSAGIGPGVVGYGSAFGNSGFNSVNLGRAEGYRCGCGCY